MLNLGHIKRKRVQAESFWTFKNTLDTEPKQKRIYHYTYRPVTAHRDHSAPQLQQSDHSLASSPYSSTFPFTLCNLPFPLLRGECKPSFMFYLRQMWWSRQEGSFMMCSGCLASPCPSRSWGLLVCSCHEPLWVSTPSHSSKLDLHFMFICLRVHFSHPDSPR